MLVFAGMGLFALALLAVRAHVRLHCCEMLLRWSGIDERQILDGAEDDRPEDPLHLPSDASP